MDLNPFRLESLSRGKALSRLKRQEVVRFCELASEVEHSFPLWPQGRQVLEVGFVLTFDFDLAISKHKVPDPREGLFDVQLCAPLHVKHFVRDLTLAENRIFKRVFFVFDRLAVVLLGHTLFKGAVQGLRVLVVTIGRVEEEGLWVVVHLF